MTYTPGDDVDIKVGGMSFRVRSVIPLPNRQWTSPVMQSAERFNVDVHLLMEGDSVYTWEEDVYLFNTDGFAPEDYEHAIRLEVRTMIGHRISKLIGTVMKLQRLSE